jgi:hypothetical protein
MNREVVPTYTNVKLGKRKNRSELLKRFEIINRKKNLNTVSKKKGRGENGQHFLHPE